MSRSIAAPALAAGARIALTLMVAFAFAATALLTPRTADASMEWCWDDPAVLIDGKLVNINIGVLGGPDAVRKHVQNAHTVIYLPVGVPSTFLYSTNRYFTETVEFRSSSRLKWEKARPGFASKVEMEFFVTFKATRKMDAQAQVWFRGKEWAKNGDTTYGTIKVQTTLQ